MTRKHTNRSGARAGTALLLFGLTACGGGAGPATPAPAEAPAGAQVDADAPPGERLRDLLPPPGAATAVEFPDYTEATLDNGARVIVVQNHEQPVVSFNLRIQSGGAADPGGLTGTANMTAGLLDKGTRTRTARDIAESIDFVGGRLSAGAADEWTSISSTVLTEFVDTALTLMSDIVMNPAFPEEELDILRNQELAGLRLQKSQPAALAQRRFTRLLYGSHPYGKVVTEESVEAIQRNHLLSFHRQHYRPGNALFVVAGDVDPDDIIARLNRAFAGWEAGEAPREPSGTPPSPSRTRMEFVHQPGSVQGVIRVGHLMPSATEADWPAIDVAMRILGGGSTGWMFDVLRQQKGYTYGAYASANERRGPGIFVAQAEVRNEVADSAMAEMLRLIEKLRDEPVPARDLELAKAYIAGSFPRSIETSQQVAGQIATEILLGRGPEYVENYRARVAAVTAADVQRVAQQYLHPDRLQMVVVGDALAIQEALAPFAVSSALYDVDDRRVTLESLRPQASDMAFDVSGLQPGARTYAVMVQGNRFGEADMTLARSGDRFTSTMAMAAGPMRVEQVAVFTTDLTPVSATMEAQGQTIEMEYGDGRVTGTIPTPDGEREIDLEVPEGTLLPGMDEYAIAVTDLDANPQFTLPVVGQEGTVTQNRIRVVGEETIEVPAGEFETYRLEVTTAQGTANLWVRKAAPHWPIQQEVPGAPVMIQLAEMD